MNKNAINTHGNFTAPATKVAVKENYLSEKDAEFNRFGIVSMAVIAVGIFGGAVVGVGGIQSDFALISVEMESGELNFCCSGCQNVYAIKPQIDNTVGGVKEETPLQVPSCH